MDKDSWPEAVGPSEVVPVIGRIHWSNSLTWIRTRGLRSAGQSAYRAGACLHLETVVAHAWCPVSHFTAHEWSEVQRIALLSCGPLDLSAGRRNSRRIVHTALPNIVCNQPPLCWHEHCVRSARCRGVAPGEGLDTRPYWKKVVVESTLDHKPFR